MSENLKEKVTTPLAGSRFHSKRQTMKKLLSFTLVLVILVAIILRVAPQTRTRTWHALLFLSVVAVIALLTWLLRNLTDSDPDPFLLNFTFFAFAGQSIRTVESGCAPPLLWALLLGTVFVIAQVYIVRWHGRVTTQHYQRVLEEISINTKSPPAIAHWARILRQITSTDVYPEYYELVASLFGSAPRVDSRNDAKSILPGSLFDAEKSLPPAFCDSENAGPEHYKLPEVLKLPRGQRQNLWRVYLVASLASWLTFFWATYLTTE